MTFKTFTAIAMALAYSVTSFAQGGNDPIDGIDIIVKEDPSQAPIMSGSFTPEQLEQLNALTGMERPAYIAKVTAGMAQKSIGGAAPKGGWNAVFQKALVENWNPDEKGGSTDIRAQAGGQAYKVSVASVCCGGLYPRPKPEPVLPIASQSNSVSTPLLLGGAAAIVGVGVLIADGGDDDDEPISP